MGTLVPGLNQAEPCSTEVQPIDGSGSSSMAAEDSPLADRRQAQPGKPPGTNLPATAVCSYLRSSLRVLRQRDPEGWIRHLAQIIGEESHGDTDVLSSLQEEIEELIDCTISSKPQVDEIEI